METILETDALLPPRKRLLAGLKRHTSDTNPQVHSAPDYPYSGCVLSLLRSNLSDEELLESSQCAAIEATKHAEAARSIAEQKAAKAAKAMEAAKRALDLLASLTEESAKKEQSLVKKSMKKNMPNETLHGKRKGKANRKKDEELVLKSHQPTNNSSPRIMKSSSVSDAKAQKHKRLKSSDSHEKADLNSGIVMIKGNVSKEDCEKVTIHNEAAKADQNDVVESGNNNAINARSNGKVSESSDSLGRKRGRMKQKKLALSVCSFKDQTEPVDEKKTGDTESQLGTLTTVC